MSFSQIQAAIDMAVRANSGRAFINANTVTRSGAVRDALETLAISCGLDEPREEGLSADQLAMLYSVARKDMSKAQAIAASWNSEETPPKRNPLLDDTTPPKRNPLLDDTTPPPATGASFDLEQVLEAARKEAGATADYIAKDRLEGVENALVTKLAAISEQQVSEALAALAPTRLQVTLPDTSTQDLGLVHYAQEDVIDLLACGLNVYLYGPAGSGKTTAGRKAADAFKLPFYFTGKIDSEYMLLGFKDARGETVRTQFREAYENGGVFLFDEVDRSAPSAFVALNAALANGICAFPDATIPRHKDFYCIAAGNTRMTGADNTYTSGQQQDASSIDRFAFVHWDYDEKLELALASNKAWCRLVQAVRAQVKARGLDGQGVLVSPRATLDGCKLLERGRDWNNVAARVLWKGLDDSTVAQLKDATRENWGLV